MGALDSWKVIFRGQWASNYEGLNLPHPGSYIELTSEAPSINIGSSVLTLSRDTSSGKLKGVVTGLATAIDFSGTAEIIVNSSYYPGSNSIIVPGNVGIGIGTTNPARKLHISDAMRLEPIASPPALPSLGDIYANTSEAVCVYASGAWVRIADTGSCS